MPASIYCFGEIDLFDFRFILVEPLYFLDDGIILLFFDKLMLDFLMILSFELFFDEGLILDIPFDLLFGRLFFFGLFHFGFEESFLVEG